MDRVQAINWIEQWADRWSVRLQPWRKPRAGEHRVGWARMPAVGESIPFEALEEITAMGGQLTFEEWGEAAGGVPGASDPAAAGEVVGQGSGSPPPINNMGGRVTLEPFRGFKVGVEQLFGGVDQFTVVGKGEELRAKMKATLQGYLGEGQAALFGHNTYAERWIFECGAELNWSQGREDWALIVRGRTLQLVGEAKHVDFLCDVAAHTDHCTRVDPRLDDYSRQLIDLAKVREAREAGNFIGPRVSQIIEAGRIGKGKLQLEGASYVFGSRESARVLFYDKGLESKGLICANRLEVAFYKDKANAAWGKLIHAARLGLEQFVQAVGQLVCGAIDFRERGEHRHIERMVRLTWWSALVDRLGRVKLKVEKVASTLNSALTSMVRQYGKKLGRALVVAEAKGEDLLLLLMWAAQRWRDGQELEDRNLSPLEAAFEPVGAFRAALSRR